MVMCSLERTPPMTPVTQDRNHSLSSRENFPVQDGAPGDRGIAPASSSTHRRDAVLVVAAATVVAVVGPTFELAERIGQWMRAGEHYQVDEWPAVILVLAIGLAWYALRRFRDASRELRERVRTEQRLSQALAEHRSLAQQYVQLQESERKRLARELHDELGQYLNAIKLDAVAIRDGAQASRDGVHDAAAAIVHGVDHVYGAVGAMIRRLRPVGLDELGLAAAIEQCVEYWRARTPGTRYALTVQGDLSALGETLDLTVYRLVQEGLTNIARHAHATRADIAIERRTEVEGRALLVLAVVDDGAGAPAGLSSRGCGLVGIRERVRALGGRIAIETAAGAGFALRAELPVPAAGTQESS